MVHLLRDRATALGEATAFTFHPSEGPAAAALSFAELDHRARAIAGFLQTQCARGDRALLLYPPGHDFLPAFFGCLYAGVVAVPAYPPRANESMRRLRGIVADAGARIALTTRSLLATSRLLTSENLGDAALALFATDEVALEQAHAWRDPAVGGDVVAFLQYTSGSTGQPKGVMLTHAQLLANQAMIGNVFRLAARQQVVGWLPLFHDMGLIGLVLHSIYSSASCALMPPATFLQRPARWLELITRLGAVLSGAPNFAYDLCVRRVTDQERSGLDLSTLRIAFNGAEPIHAATLERFAERFGPCGFRAKAFLPCYGMAEASLLVSGKPAPRAPVMFDADATELAAGHARPAANGAAVRRLVSSGRVAPGLRAVIVDPVARTRLPDGRVGEIWIRGASVGQGYWNKPALTAATFDARLAGCRGPAYLRTGDLGFLHGRELFVTGRCKDLILVRGRNHYPQDLEVTAGAAHPGLRAHGTVAFAVDGDATEGLVIVQEVERTALRELQPSAVMAAIRAALVREHELSPSAVILVRPATVPKTSSGKLQRAECRRMFLAGELDIVAEWREASATALATQQDDNRRASTQARPTAAELQAWLVQRVAATLQLPESAVDPRAGLQSLGLDSMSAVALAGDLEVRLGTPIPATLAYDHPTLEQIARHFGAGEPGPDEKATPRPNAGDDADARTVAIVGIGCRFPGGADNPEAFWAMLQAGVDAVGPIPPERWDAAAYFDANPDTPNRVYVREGAFLKSVDGFDPEFFGISPREAAAMDPQHRLLLEVAWEALEHAGVAPASLARRETGVFVGVSFDDYARLGTPAGESAPLDAHSALGGARSLAAGRLSYHLGLRGPSLLVDTLCSSSLVAVHLAVQSLRNGECSIALAGGANLMLSPDTTIASCKLRALAPDARCKTFDAAADGYGRGEGAGVIVLKRLSDARADGDAVLAVIRGTAVNHNGRSNGITAPSGAAQEALLRKALSDARVNASTVGFVETHGTGTVLGDPIEVQALARVYGEGRPANQPLLLGAVKTNLGHLESAAGIAGLIKAVLVLQRGIVPANLHFKQPNPYVPWATLPVRVAQAATNWAGEGRLAGVSSFGLGGTNAHVILGGVAAEPTPPAELDRACHVFALSARSPAAGVALAKRWATKLAASPDASLGDLCFTANAGRNHWLCRLALPVAANVELLARLQTLREADFTALSGRAPAALFVFGETAGATPDARRELYATQPTFRAELAKCGAALAGGLEMPLAADWFCAGNPAATFAVQLALVRLLESWGIKPAAVVGRAGGELAAAHVAGVLSFEAAVAILGARRRCRECAVAAADEDTPGVKLAALALRTAARASLATLIFSEPTLPLLLAGHPDGTAWGDYWLRDAAPTADCGERMAIFTSARPEALAFDLAAGWRDLARSVAHLYQAGLDIDWTGFDRDYRRRRVAGLPTYPFERQRCWRGDVPRQPRSDSATFEIVWRSVPPATSGAGAVRGKWIVCSTGDRCAALQQALAARGQSVRAVAPSAWTDDVAAGASAFVFCGVPVAEVARLLRTLPPGDAAGARVHLVTQNAVATGRETAPLALGESPLAGFARAFALERPDEWGGLVDVENLSRAEDCAHVVDELLRSGDETFVAWRARERLAPRLVRATLPTEAKVTFAPDGTFLITGGTGGLGLGLARWLVAHGARHLALLSRRGATRDAEATIRELEAAGASVRVFAADVASRPALEKVFAAIDATLPPLRGVFHAAGVSGFAPLSAVDDERFAAVLRPKIIGAELLHELTRERSLDCFVLFSSIAAVWGSYGQTHYAGANSFLDTLAHERRRLGLPALTVNWGPWDEAGMADPAAREQLRRVGLAPLAPDFARQTLGRALIGGRTQCVVADVNWAVLGPLLALRRPQPLLAEVIDAPAAAATTPAPVRARLNALDRTQRNAALATYLHAEVARVLGRDPGDPIGPEEGFFTLGMDSLMAVELRAKLEADLGLSLPATVAFDRATLAALAEELGGFLFPDTKASRAEPSSSVPSRPVSATEPIAIVGLGCRFPGGVQSADDFWKLLCAGRDAVRPLPAGRWDVDEFFHADPTHPGTMYVREFGVIDDVERFDAGFFNLYPREAVSMDPQQRLLLETAWEALEMAGAANDRLRGSATAVFVGASTSDYAQLLLAAGDATRIDAYFGTGNALNAIAGRLAFTFGLRGPTMTTDTACSSSLVALHQACQSLRAGECTQAIVAGVNLILAPEPVIALSRARMLAPDGRCKTFSAAADGYGRGEGCGALVVKRLADAQAAGDTVLAVISGTAVNQDGASGGFTVPSGTAQQELVRRALAQAGRSPDELDYVEAHGTGTPLGDPIEINALAAVVGRSRARPLVVGAVKTNLGHLEAAAGIAGVIKTVLALRHGAIPPHLHFAQPNPHIAWEQVPIRVPVQLAPWPDVADRPRVAGVSAFGFTGTNAHVILESIAAPAPPATGGDGSVHLVPLSARSGPALVALRRRLFEWLRARPDAALADLALTFGAGRVHHAYREIYCAGSTVELRAKLEAALEARAPTAVSASPAVALVCANSAALDRGRRWLRWGIKPAAVVGNGAGLAAAGALAGIFSEDDAAAIAQDAVAIERVELRSPQTAFCTSAGRIPDELAGTRAWWRDALRARNVAGDAINLPAHYRVLSLEDAPPESALRATAELYLAGATFDWRAITGEAGRHLPDAPLYPFQRDRYWVEAGGGPRIARPKRVGRAALLGERLSLPGSTEIRFAAEYSAAAPAVLEHHRLFGRVIAPAAQHIALLIAAARTIARHESCALAELSFPHAILLDEAATQAVQLVLTPGTDGTFAAQLLGAPPTGADAAWTTHAAGRVLSGPVTPAHADEASARTDLGATHVGGGQLYAELASAGYTLGPSFRWIRSIAKAEDRGVAELVEPAGTLERDGYELHPGLLDSCFQSLGWCAGVDPTELAGGAALYIPAKMASVRFHRPAHGTKFRCEVHVTEPDHARMHRLRGNLVLRDEAGALVLEVNGFEARRMPRALISGAGTAAPHDIFYAIEWEELAAREGSNAKAGREWELRGDAAAVEGVAARLRARGETAYIGSGADQSPQCVVFLSPSRAVQHADISDAAAQLLCLIQELSAQRTPPRLFVVTTGSQSLPADGVGVSAGEAAVGALARIAALEHPELKLRVIDLDPGAAAIEWAGLELELLEPTEESVVALRGHRRFGPRFVPSQPAQPPAGPVRLAVGRYGELESLVLRPAPRSGLRAGEVELEVSAAGLNFRDVLNALGVLRAHLEQLGVSSAGELPLGGECAGIVTAVGEGVRHVRAGDRVIAALATGSMGSHVVVDGRFVVHQPLHFSPAEAATLPVAYVTAHYALRHLAKLRAGERVLIHAATGGVGLAALHIARLLGAEVCATASPAKWPMLRSLGVTVIGNSRATDYAAEFGPVDVVLNSLTGDHIPKSLALLRAGGRFVEIGKLGIWSAEQMVATRPDVVYRAFDLVEMAQNSPGLIERLMQELAQDWNARRLPALPVRTFPLAAAAGAFRWMAQAKHVGKIVLVPARSSPRVRQDGVYLVTGGLGAIGLAVARWLVGARAGTVVLVSRRAPTPEQEEAMAALRATGATIVWRGADLALTEAVRAIVTQCVEEFGALHGVFHAAGVLDDGAIAQQTPARLAAVLAPKAAAAWALHEATLAQPVEMFVLFSSLAAWLGAPGQSTYAAANAELDALAHERRRLGLPALSVAWGPWAGGGMAARLGERERARLAGMGLSAFSEQEGVAALQALLGSVESRMAAVRLDRPTLRGYFGTRLPPILRKLEVASLDTPGREKMLTALRAAPASNRTAMLAHALEAQLVSALALPAGDRLDRERSLVELGVDSLLAIELKSWIAGEFGIEIPMQDMAGSSLANLARSLLRALQLEDAEQSAAAPASIETVLKADASLPDDIRASGPAPTRAGENVLLTGATGFLGAFLLHELLQHTSARVHCLVRAKSDRDGRRRIVENLQRYGLPIGRVEERVVIVAGDLAEPHLGLSDADFTALSENVDTIYHNGAWLNFFYPYATLKPANVTGTLSVLRLAARGAPKPVHYVSTSGVFYSRSYHGQALPETDPAEDCEGHALGYSQTKWVAERLVAAAAERGLPVTIYRAPFITGHSETGAWNADDFICRLVRGIVAVGAMPELGAVMDIVPVDYVAQAIVRTAQAPAASGVRRLHLAAPEPVAWKALAEWLGALGYPVRRESYPDWLKRLPALRGTDHPLAPFVPLFLEQAGPGRATVPEVFLQSAHARLDSRFTARLLEAARLGAPVLDAALWQRYFTALQAAGLLPPPTR